MNYRFKLCVSIFITKKLTQNIYNIQHFYMTQKCNRIFLN